MLNQRNILIILTLIVISLFIGGLNTTTSPQKLTILHTNDMHGTLVSRTHPMLKEKAGSIAKRATLIKNIRDKNTLVLDSGDFSQGSLFTKVYGGIPVLNFMKAMNYDAITLGNHEFDNGIKGLEKLLNSNNFNYLAANLKVNNQPELNNKIKPYVIKNVNGLKVGIIGVITDELLTTSAVTKDDVALKDYIETTQKYANLIEDKTDIIIVLSHCGYKQDIALAKNVDNIDVIIGGHSHTFLKKPTIINDNIIVQAGEFGLFLGKLDLNIKNKKIANFEYNLIAISDPIKDDKEMSVEIQKLSKGLADIKKEVLGKTNLPLDATRNNIRTSLTNAGRLIINSMEANATGDIVLVNSGGIRLHREIKTDDITRADTLKMLPFDNKIATIDIKGSDLKDILEHSVKNLPDEDKAFLQSKHISYIVDTKKPKGQRVSHIKIKGEKINYNKYYRVITVDFLANGGDNFTSFLKGKNYQDTYIEVEQALCDYIKQNSPLNIKKPLDVYIKGL